MNEKEKWMKIAISLAKRGEGKVSPNPMVGAVILREGKLISKGYHRYFGGPHAEVDALKKAGKKARGATLFVNLEPCCHFGKTPPCTQAIIKAGIRKVIVAVKDPNPLNNGKGLEELKKAGIEVEVGICKEEATKLNEFFFKYVQKKVPFVIVKAAASLDGKIATCKGESKWITSEKSRKLGKKLRNKVDAILVGINTVLKDDPELLPLQTRKRFFRIVLDSELKTPLQSKILENQASFPTLIFTTEKAKDKKVKTIIKKGVEVIRVSSDPTGRVNPSEVLKKLGERQIASLLVEGGGEVIGSFIREKLVDKIYLFLSPRLIGGKQAPTWLEGRGFEALSETPKLDIIRLRKIEEDILLEGYVK